MHTPALAGKKSKSFLKVKFNQSIRDERYFNGTCVCAIIPAHRSINIKYRMNLKCALKFKGGSTTIRKYNIQFRLTFCISKWTIPNDKTRQDENWRKS